MNQRLRLLQLCCLSVAGLLAAARPALPIFDDGPDPANSLEWLVASSDLMVRGTVVDMAAHSESAGPRRRWFQVKVQAVKTVKGPPHEIVEFRIDYPLSRSGALLTHPLVQEVLVFLVHDPRLPGAGPGQAGGWRAAEIVLCLKAGHVRCLSGPVVVMDLRVLAGQDDMFSAVRVALACSSPTSSPRAVLLQAPGYAEKGSAACQSGCLPVQVPCDYRLKNLADGWLQSSDIGLRAVACQALREFDLSEKSVASLKRLLDDPYYVVLEERVERLPYDPRRWFIGDHVAYEVRWYPIREAAYETLGQGGVTVRKPTIREADVGWLDMTLRWGSVGLGAVVLVVLAMVVRRLLRAARAREEGHGCTVGNVGF